MTPMPFTPPLPILPTRAGRKKRLHISLLLFAIFFSYIARLTHVESNREHSQNGFAQAIGNVTGKDVRANLWANGLGCTYWLRLKNCIGVELINSVPSVELSEQIDFIATNFCNLVERSYPKEKYIFHSGALAKEFDLGLGHAYQVFFDCNRARVPIGEIRVYASPHRRPTSNAEWLLKPMTPIIFQRIEWGKK